MVANDEQILDAIRLHIEEHGSPPTFRELGSEVGIKSPSAIKYRLDRLKERGLIEFDFYKPRTIRLMKFEQQPR